MYNVSMNNKVSMQYNKKNGIIRSYVFNVIIEPDEDGWFAHCPALEKRGAATWGKTKKEAAKNIQDVLEMVVEGMIEDGERMPVKPEGNKEKISFNSLVNVRA